MVVDAAVVGLAVGRGVGHDHAAAGWSRQSGPLRVGGQQYGSQRRLAEQAATFVDAKQ